MCSVDLVQDVVEDGPLARASIRLQHGINAAFRDDWLREACGQVLEDRRASAVVLEDFGEENRA
jgi:hypothetical protein